MLVVDREYEHQRFSRKHYLFSEISTTELVIFFVASVVCGAKYHISVTSYFYVNQKCINQLGACSEIQSVRS